MGRAYACRPGLAQRRAQAGPGVAGAGAQADTGPVGQGCGIGRRRRVARQRGVDDLRKVLRIGRIARRRTPGGGRRHAVQRLQRQPVLHRKGGREIVGAVDQPAAEQPDIVAGRPDQPPGGQRAAPVRPDQAGLHGPQAVEPAAQHGDVVAEEIHQRHRPVAAGRHRRHGDAQRAGAEVDPAGGIQRVVVGRGDLARPVVAERAAVADLVGLAAPQVQRRVQRGVAGARHLVEREGVLEGGGDARAAVVGVGHGVGHCVGHCGVSGGGRGWCGTARQPGRSATQPGHGGDQTTAFGLGWGHGRCGAMAGLTRTAIAGC